MSVSVVDNGIIDELVELDLFHSENCPEYRRLTSLHRERCGRPSALEEIFPLPAGVFKWLDLKSTSDDEIIRVMKSSGTQGLPSRISLDRKTARYQEREFTKSFSRVFGNKRRSMLIVDSASILSGTTRDSARAAASLAHMRFGTNHFWALDENGIFDQSGLAHWISTLEPEAEILIFGFTHMLWQHLTELKLGRLFREVNALIIHGGGWKKLESAAVSHAVFKEQISALFAQSRIHDYYGMIEQLGSTWFEGSDSVLLPPASGAAIIRDPRSLEIKDLGEWGLVQVFSTIPRSYPGHSILTEDIGRVVPNNYQPEVFGPHGLEIRGRLPKVELRGCSDAV